MNPTNQIILGGQDPLLMSSLQGGTYEDRIRLLEIQKRNLEQAQRQEMTESKEPTIWNNIDVEINSMSEEHQIKLFQNEDYVTNNNYIQQLVQAELLSLVKHKIENSTKGKELLKTQLDLVKSLKKSIIKESNDEMELFKRFREFSAKNPNVTYEEFIKNNK